MFLGMICARKQIYVELGSCNSLTVKETDYTVGQPPLLPPNTGQSVIHIHDGLMLPEFTVQTPNPYVRLHKIGHTFRSKRAFANRHICLLWVIIKP